MTDHWLFASGAVAAVLAAWAWIADCRRARRRHLERVGFMPWLDVFVWSVLAAVLLFGVALKAGLSG